MSVTIAKYFSPYVDMGWGSSYHNLPTIAADSGVTSFTLGFVNASSDDPNNTAQPTIAWHGSGAAINDSLTTQQVTQLQGQGDTITISFGGAFGIEPAVAWDHYYTNSGQPVTPGSAGWAAAVSNLQAQYQSVIDQYHVHNLDFDIEGSVVDDTNANHLRDAAIKNLEAVPANSGLKISYTLQVEPAGANDSVKGLPADVKAILDAAAADGTKIDVVNLMTMDYYDDQANTADMATKAEQAATYVHDHQLPAGLVSNTGAAPLIGITPMIGVNDDTAEVFSLKGASGTTSDGNAQTLETWASQQSWVAGIGMWSILRDHDANEQPVDPNRQQYNDLHSGVSQSPYDFSKIFNQIAHGSMPPPTGQTFTADATHHTYTGTAAGNDTVDYHVNATSGVTVDLKITTAQAVGGGLGSETLTSIENLTGTNFSDHLTGNSGANMLTGNGGDDFLNGRGGGDTLSGGTGNDTYYVHANDHVIETGGDLLDKVYVVDTSYTLDPNALVEYLYADDGATGVTLNGNSTSHHIIGSAGVDHLNGGDGDDLLNGNAGADFMTGGKGNDSYYVNDANDHITELAGAAEGTADKAYISSSSYNLDANAHVEYLYANVSTGVAITGNAFTTHIVGGAGSDHLTGGSGNEFINGGKGNDTITGGGGGDTLTGGAGDDHFVFNSIADSPKVAGQYDNIVDFTQGQDKIDLTAIDANGALAGDPTFHWVGSGAFVAAGDLRAVVNANGSTTITGDTDGNHVADFEIVLLAQAGHAPVTLTANDFLGVHV